MSGGEVFSAGGQRWEVLHTPGHSYGHVCLWSPDQGVSTITTSVRKTARAVVLLEAARRLGYGAQIGSVITEECFWSLDHPVVRIAAKNTPIPTSPPLEDDVVPQTAEVVETLRQIAIRGTADPSALTSTVRYDDGTPALQVHPGPVINQFVDDSRNDAVGAHWPDSFPGRRSLSAARSWATDGARSTPLSAR